MPVYWSTACSTYAPTEVQSISSAKNDPRSVALGSTSGMIAASSAMRRILPYASGSWCSPIVIFASQ